MSKDPLFNLLDIAGVSYLSIELGNSEGVSGS